MGFNPKTAWGYQVMKIPLVSLLFPIQEENLVGVYPLPRWCRILPMWRSISSSVKAGEPCQICGSQPVRWFLSLAQGSSLWSCGLHSEAGKALNMANVNSLLVTQTLWPWEVQEYLFTGRLNLDPCWPVLYLGKLWGESQPMLQHLPSPSSFQPSLAPVLFSGSV